MATGSKNPPSPASIQDTAQIQVESDRRVMRLGDKLMKKATLDPAHPYVTAKEIESLFRRELGLPIKGEDVYL